MIETWHDFWHLFHRRWGSDRGDEPTYRESYSKREWGEMQMFLEQVEREVAREALR